MPDDTTIRDAYAEHFGETPSADWQAMEARIVDAARSRLATKAARRSWTAPAARWARVAIPVGLAAGIALVLGLAATSGTEASDQTGLADVVVLGAANALPDYSLGVLDQDAYMATLLGSGD